MTCGECCSILYKSDGKTVRKKAGVQDFCGAGCIIVENIRVPFPDCVIHSMTRPH